MIHLCTRQEEKPADKENEDKKDDEGPGKSSVIIVIIH